jgi:hypothetical protein
VRAPPIEERPEVAWLRVRYVGQHEFQVLDRVAFIEIDLPEQPRHQHARRESELQHAEATTAAFERLEVLGPVIVEVRLSEDLLAG